MNSDDATCALCGDEFADDPDDFYCFGCDAFICDRHAESPWGKHHPQDHRGDGEAD